MHHGEERMLKVDLGSWEMSGLKTLGSCARRLCESLMMEEVVAKELQGRILRNGGFEEEVDGVESNSRYCV